MAEPFPRRPELERTAREVNAGCTGCRICVRQCAFLKMNAPPGRIAQALLTGAGRTDPFACSLCGLCGALCPEMVKPGNMFLEMRREAVDQGRVDWKRYKAILNYERRGHSALFSWYPTRSSKNVFFPGCTLPGTRPRITWQFFEALRSLYPDMAMVLDCCHKPSHDLGRQSFFLERFQGIQDRLLALGVKRLFVACPNCHKVFKQYGGGQEVVTVYEALAQGRYHVQGQEAVHQDFAISPDTSVQVAIHDPCPLRDEPKTHEAVRALLSTRGFALREMKNSRTRTLCCGEGGSVGFHTPALATTWAKKRRAQSQVRGQSQGHSRDQSQGQNRSQAQADRVVTYCAGCTACLNRFMPTSHLGDLLFDPNSTLAGKNRPAKAPITYLNRLLFKRRLKRFS
ncbi:(Fe-S)-binding protein [Desulfonatronum thioautotrophicum]|uniref:(Fe-S)-binding protein n=1 Tax=Desulfonatronum thioautotrophicum TaxID=617001 RepID=UPI0005EB1080|nr:(Fe-S)-binding protein [Desulfonatronum thioautotrophicum]